jgi:ABC-type transporter Mla MlaB component
MCGMENLGTVNLIHLKGRASSVTNEGIQYVDMTNVQFITSSDIAELITLVKTGMGQGTEVRLVNVKDSVRSFITKLELDSILYCE